MPRIKPPSVRPLPIVSRCAAAGLLDCGQSGVGRLLDSVGDGCRRGNRLCSDAPNHKQSLPTTRDEFRPKLLGEPADDPGLKHHVCRVHVTQSTVSRRPKRDHLATGKHHGGVPVTQTRVPDGLAVEPWDGFERRFDQRVVLCKPELPRVVAAADPHISVSPQERVIISGRDPADYRGFVRKLDALRCRLVVFPHLDPQLAILGLAKRPRPAFRVEHHSVSIPASHREHTLTLASRALEQRGDGEARGPAAFELVPELALFVRPPCEQFASCGEHCRVKHATRHRLPVISFDLHRLWCRAKAKVAIGNVAGAELPVLVAAERKEHSALGAHHCVGEATPHHCTRASIKLRNPCWLNCIVRVPKTELSLLVLANSKRGPIPTQEHCMAVATGHCSDLVCRQPPSGQASPSQHEKCHGASVKHQALIIGGNVLRISSRNSMTSHPTSLPMGHDVATGHVGPSVVRSGRSPDLGTVVSVGSQTDLN
eukprot:m.248891 g.248891  ORF g.248891 m.248891 type:complete len:483 (-) comp26476_c1_seq9:230-1678(-)